MCYSEYLFASPRTGAGDLVIVSIPTTECGATAVATLAS